MSRELLQFITIAAALGCGTVGGVFFAFSTFVMKGLGRLAPSLGIASMQSINVTVINPWFIGAFLGTAGLCVTLLAWSLLTWRTEQPTGLLAGGILYLVGSLLVTAVCQVPRNDALAALDAADPMAVRFWRDYLTAWTVWNHVRTVASLAAAGMFLFSLCRPFPHASA